MLLMLESMGSWTQMFKGKTHYIEVFSKSEYEEQNVEQSIYVVENYESTDELQPQIDLGKIIVMYGIQRFHTLQFKGVVLGQRVIILVDGGATHKFIIAAMVESIIFPLNILMYLLS